MARRMVGNFVTFGRAMAVLAAAPGLAAVAAADTLSLDLNNDAARLSYAHTVEGRNMRLDASWLHHQDNGDVLSTGFHVTGNAATESRPVNAGVGGRVYYVDSDAADADGTALAIGGFFDAKLPTYDRIGFGGHAYYAPDVLAFGDADDLLDISVHASYSIVRQADAYAGLRSVKADFDGGGEVTIDTGLFVGVTLKF